MRSRRRRWLGIALVVCGDIILPWNWLTWGVVWPAAVIAVGVIVLLFARKD